MESLKTSRACSKCGELNIVNVENLNEKEVYDENGEWFRIMFICCENCKHIEVVQIDNKQTYDLMCRLKILILKNAKKNRKGETISPKDVRKKDKWMKKLRNDRKELETLCDGKKLLDENKNIVVESLTFAKVGDIIEHEKSNL